MTEMLNKEFTRKSFIKGGVTVVALTATGAASAATGNTPFGKRTPDDFTQNTATIEEGFEKLAATT